MPEYAFPKRLADIVARIEARWPDAAPKQAERDAEAICLRVLGRLRKADWPARLSEIASAVRAVFSEGLRGDRRFVELRDFAAREIAVSTRAGLLWAGVDAYLDSWAPGAAHTRALAIALRTAQPRMPARRAKLFVSLPELLDPEKGALRLAARLAKEEKPRATLVDSGLGRETGGFMAQVHAALVDALAPALAKPDDTAFDRLAEWLRRPDGRGRDFGAGRALEAILAPWEKREPPQSYRDKLLRQLIDLYGDPRGDSPTWAALPPRARGPILRWLVGATLELFLDVVTKAEESVAYTHWQTRNPFWRELHAAKRINDACVAFSDDAARIMRSMIERDRSRADIFFARQTARGSRSRTSLLILRIGSKIVVEGSHNYKVHIFSDQDRNAPQLHAAEYNAESIRLSLTDDRKQVHDQYGNWRHWVRERI